MIDLTLADAALVLCLAAIGVAVAWAAFLYGAGGGTLNLEDLPPVNFGAPGNTLSPECPGCGIDHSKGGPK